MILSWSCGSWVFSRPIMVASQSDTFASLLSHFPPIIVLFLLYLILHFLEWCVLLIAAPYAFKILLICSFTLGIYFWFPSHPVKFSTISHSRSLNSLNMNVDYNFFLPRFFYFYVHFELRDTFLLSLGINI